MDKNLSSAVEKLVMLHLDEIYIQAKDGDQAAILALYIDARTWREDIKGLVKGKKEVERLRREVAQAEREKDSLQAAEHGRKRYAEQRHRIFAAAVNILNDNGGDYKAMLRTLAKRLGIGNKQRIKRALRPYQSYIETLCK